LPKAQAGLDHAEYVPKSAGTASRSASFVQVSTVAVIGKGYYMTGT
jgi:hypothetical protein